MTPHAPAGADEQLAFDPEQVNTLLQRCIDDAQGNAARRLRDLTDLYNVMFYWGGQDNHWSILNKATGRIEPQPYEGPAGIPAWVPRCVTNVYANKLDGVVSILNQSKPSKTFAPATDDDDDIAAADVAEQVDPVLLDEIGYEPLKRLAHLLISLTDKVAFVYSFDNDERHGTWPIGLMQCLDCQELMTPMETEGSPAEEMDAAGDDAEPAAICPHCESTNVVPATDPRTGAPIGVDYPVGKICADVWCSFEFSLPSTARSCDAKRNPWVLGHQELSIEQACELWPEHADAIRKAGPARSSGQSELTRQYAEWMRTMSSPSGTRAVSEKAQNTVMVYRLQHDPIKDPQVDFREGLHCVKVGDVLVHTGPLPVKNARGQRRKSIIIRTFQDTPMSPHGKPPADDIQPLQKRRNRIESLLELILMHHAAPTTYLPASVELIDEPTGMPGLMVRFRSMDGQRPHTEKGMNPPEGLYKALELIDAKMDELSRMNSVLQGTRPDGDPTLGEVQILQERGMASFRTPLDHLIDFEREQSLMLLDIARETAWAPRFRRVLGENKQWEVQQFTAADLSGEVDITIEPLSAWPKSPSMQLVKLSKAIELGVLAPANDPEVASKTLVLLDLGDMKPSLDADRLQVARMLDRWKAATLPQEIEPPDLAVIEIPFHLHHVKQFLKTEGAEAVKRENRPVWDAMVAYVQQLQLAMMPAPTDGAPAGPDGSAVQGAVDAGVLVPQGAEPPAPPPPDPMQAAVDAGALMPQGAVDAGQPAGPSIDELLDRGLLFPGSPAPPGA